MPSSIKLINTHGKTVSIVGDDSITQDITYNLSKNMYTVDTVAALRSMTSVPEYVYASGYHTKNDGAFGSHFFRLATDTGQVDNSGTIIRTVNGVYELQYDGAVNVKWFGAVGNGVTDDSSSIQQAIEFAFSIRSNVTANSHDTYGILTTLIIPQYSNYTGRGISLDFNGCSFKMLANTPLFTSGYDNGGVLTTNFGTPIQTHPSSGISLMNFVIESNVGNLTHTALKIQDWYQGSLIADISTLYFERILHSSNNFYCEFRNIRAYLNSATNVGTRFFFDGNHNLNKISKLVATNAAMGYRFDGPVTALEISNMSFEGQTVGIEFNSSVYDCTIRDSYFEAISDVMVSVSDYVFSLKLENNYCNFGNSATTFLLTYTGLPANNILIDETNHFQSIVSTANIIKVKEDIYGSGIVIKRFQEAGVTLDDTLLDSTIFGANITFEQVRKFPYSKSNTSNGLLVGNYSGKYTTGFVGQNGFEWIDGSNNLLVLRTRIQKNYIQLVYVAIKVAHTTGGPTYIKGLFIGDTFYEADGSAMTANSKLTASAFSGNLQINGGIYFNTTITGVTGEVRII